MKFVIDRHIPFIEGVLEPYGDVVYALPQDIIPAMVADADALLVRTRTRIDADLLEGGKCRFVATATIGMDHFDMDWCKARGVTALNAPGCNAPAVAQYVFAAIARLWPRPLADTTLAVVGVGNVGGIVRRWAESMGMKVLVVDPPRAEAERTSGWSDMADVARQADIITFHTPLTRTGAYPTHHLADTDFFNSLKRRPLVINASRGGVVDNRAWLEAIKSGLTCANVVDVWEGEPTISKELMNAADIVTPHIAGYSMDGKIRATGMVLDGVSRHFGLPELKADSRPACSVPQSVTLDDVASSYDIMGDDRRMRTAIMSTRNDAQLRTVFEQLRDKYPLREEVTQRI